DGLIRTPHGVGKRTDKGRLVYLVYRAGHFCAALRPDGLCVAPVEGPGDVKIRGLAVRST
ncbi:MAG TPA: hypothetical protein VL154_13690, partial [Acetobacteraceae bacterium]|nr:hypothetical protein [Acetobacteraceae bacterium]